MKRTFCTVIRDEQAEEILAPMAELFARVRHWAFREIHIRGRKVKDVKRESLVKFGITARHFNGIRFDLDQDANAWKEGLKYRQQSLKDRIKDLSKQIAGLEKRLKSPKKKLSNRKKKQTKFTIHQKKRHLGIQKHKLTVVESDLAGKPKVCFGGRKLLRRDEVWEWRERRSSRINLVGAGDETAGNQSAQWDGKALAIRLPNALGGERKVLTGITFRYGQEELLRALESKAPLTWVLFRDEQGRWQARVTIENDVADITCDTSCGIIGVDLNVDHLAVVMVDRMGNPVGRESIPFPVSGTASDKASGMIGEAIKQLTDMALERGCAVAVENLDFSRKKANLKSFVRGMPEGYQDLLTPSSSRCWKLVVSGLG